MATKKATTDPADELKIETKALVTRARPFTAWLQVKDGAGLDDPKLTDLRTSMVTVKELRVELEKRRKSYVDPLNGVVKRINAECKTADAPLAMLETHCKGLLTQSLAAQQAEALAAVERQAKAAERKGNDQYAQDLRNNAVTSVTVAGNGVSTRSNYRAHVMDIEGLLKAVVARDPTIYGVTRDTLLAGFTEVAEKVFGALARQMKATGQIAPGVESVEEKIVAVSA